MQCLITVYYMQFKQHAEILLQYLYSYQSLNLTVGRVRNEKIDNHQITPLLFQTVGHIKVFFYVPIYLVYLSLYDGNRD